MIDELIKDTESKNLNHPLLRKYFKAGNARLLNHIISGLTNSPTNQVLLSALGYFHENRKILSQIIHFYTIACNEESNVEMFKDLCIDFINDTDPDGYDALAALKSIFRKNTEKHLILEEITQIMHDQEGVIEF